MVRVGAGGALALAPLEAEVREVEREAVAVEPDPLVALDAAPAAGPLLADAALAVDLPSASAISRASPPGSAVTSPILGHDHGLVAGVAVVEDEHAAEPVRLGRGVVHAEGVAAEAVVEHARLELEAGLALADVGPQRPHPVARLRQHHRVEVHHPEGHDGAGRQRGPRQPPEREIPAPFATA